MRTHKFRAWEDGKMYYQVRVGGIFDGIPTAPTVWDDERGDWINLTGQPYTKVMEFTGLTDSAANEVWEGDKIVDELFRTYEVRFGEHLTSTDYYASTAYGWFAISSEGEEFSLVQVYGDYEVVGNIYEN